MKLLLKKFWQEEDGATAIEYGLIAGLVAVAIVVTLTSLGTGLSGVFDSIVDKLPVAAEDTSTTTPDPNPGPGGS